MTTIKNIASMMLLICAAGCSRLDETGISPQTAVKTDIQDKIILRSARAEQDKLIVFVGEKLAESIEESEAPLSDGIFGEVGALHIRRVFPPVGRTEERARQYGLHRWYEVSLPDSVGADNAAQALAGSPEIVRVQFCTQVKKASDGVVFPYSGPRSALSAAADAPFNDPSLADQWH